MSIAMSIISTATNLAGKYMDSKDKKAALAHDIATLADNHAHEQVLAQVKLNTAEAQHRSLFVAGWRPAIGWICGVGMVSNFIIIPMANFGLALNDSEIVIPLVDLATMMPVLVGMLGLGGLRTFEKAKKLTK